MTRQRAPTTRPAMPSNGWKCEYMRDKVGETFDGTVSAVGRPSGLFVLLKEIFVEGRASPTCPATITTSGSAGPPAEGERWTLLLARRARVRVARVDLDERKIDLCRPDVAGVGIGLPSTPQTGRCPPRCRPGWGGKATRAWGGRAITATGTGSRTRSLNDEPLRAVGTRPESRRHERGTDLRPACGRCGAASRAAAAARPCQVDQRPARYAHQELALAEAAGVRVYAEGRRSARSPPVVASATRRVRAHEGRRTPVARGRTRCAARCHRGPALLLVLDGVRDPNLGACLHRPTPPACTRYSARTTAPPTDADRAQGGLARERVPFIPVTNLARTLRKQQAVRHLAGRRPAGEWPICMRWISPGRGGAGAPGRGKRPAPADARGM